MFQSLHVTNKLIVVLFLASGAVTAKAQDPFSQDFPNHIVHYNVFNSSLLEPEIAQQYQLKRGANIDTLNLAVHRKTDTGTVAVDALLKGTVTNLMQQQQVLEFIRVKEGDAIYFLSQFRVKDSIPKRFHFYIRPEGHPKTFEFEFTRPLP